MVVRADQERVKTLLKEAIPLLCKNGLSFNREFCIEALVGITLDQNDVFLVSIKETVKSDFTTEGHSETVANEGALEVNVTRQPSKEMVSPKTSKSHRKRRRSKNSPSKDGSKEISDSESDTGILDSEETVPQKKEKRENSSFVDGNDGTIQESNRTSEHFTKPSKLEPDDNEYDSEDAIIIKDEPVSDDYLAGMNFGEVVNQNYNMNQSATTYSVGGASNLPYAQGSADSSSNVGQPSVMHMIPNVSQGQGDGQEPASPGQLVVKHSCVECNFSTKFRSSLMRHKATVHGGQKQNQFRCKICEKKFKNDEGLRSHCKETQHVKGAYIICEICGRQCFSKKSYRNHMLSHNPSKGWSCDFCEKSFLTRQDLQGHVNGHTKQATFECKGCKKKFRHQSALSRHSRSCMKQETFNCTSCKKRFFSPDALRDHIKAIHEAKLSYQCRKCGLPFAYRSSRMRHERKCN